MTDIFSELESILDELDKLDKLDELEDLSVLEKNSKVMFVSILSVSKKIQKKNVIINESKNTIDFYYINKGERVVYFHEYVNEINYNLKNRQEIKANLKYE